MDKQEIINRLNITDYYASELRSFKPYSSEQGKGLCPFHDDTEPSLSVNLRTGVFNCFGCKKKGSLFDFYMERNGVDFPEAKKALAELAGLSSQPGRQEMEAYDYTDETGKLLFQTIRYEPKDFRQRRPDGNGGWIYNLTDVRKVPYKLPSILKSVSVIIVEGEKDADNLGRIGFTASCCPMGAGKWKPEYNEHFRDRDVVIIPDNDEPGRKHSRDVANSLKGIARTLKILDLEGLAEKEDVTDWIERRYEEGKDDSEVRAELLSLIEDTPGFVEKQKEPPADIFSFPKQVISGVAGDFADLYSQYLESPPEFFYFSFLTCLGSFFSDRLTSETEIAPQPRFYAILIGESADDRKSTAAAKTIDFFRETFTDRFHVCYGVGSAEGLQKRLEDATPSRLLLFFDEFKSFVGKCRIEASILLPCVNTLFESNRYESQTKKTSIYLEDAYLSILAATTKATFDSMWTSSFTDIGFTNRLFLVPGRGKRKHAMPRQIPESLKTGIKIALGELMALVSKEMIMRITNEGRELYEEWYGKLEQSVHAKRVDTIALRLLPLLAINDKKKQIDRETVEKAIAISNWQLEVRKELDPIDADNEIAKMEGNIRRQLRKQSLRKRELKQNTNAYKKGLWIFEKALENLMRAGEVTFDKISKDYSYSDDEA